LANKEEKYLCDLLDPISPQSNHRNSLRYFVRGLFQLLSRTSISGLEIFPKNGPPIAVENHTGAMEVVLIFLTNLLVSTS